MRIDLNGFKRRMFWMVARTCFTLYRWFPLFGTLRASIAIVLKEEKFLAIVRNDGRGFSLPGGIARRREPEEETLRREVEEETGLRVSRGELRLRYYSRTDVPCTISVFEVHASGKLKNSWEGSPHWMTLGELEPRLLPSQRPVLELLRQLAANSKSTKGDEE